MNRNFFKKNDVKNNILSIKNSVRLGRRLYFFSKNLVVSSLVVLQISTTLYANGDQQIVPYAGATHPEDEQALRMQRTRNKTPFGPTPVEIFKNSLGYLDLPSLEALNGTSKTCRVQMQGEIRKRQAQARIHQLIGNLITVKAGAFEYVDDLNFDYMVVSIHNLVPLLVKVPQAFQLQENDVSQEQYDLIASQMKMPTADRLMNPCGGELYLVGPKKPIGGMKEWMRQSYIAGLNETLAKLWPIAYPGQTVPVMRLPNEDELRLAMSDPLLEEEQTVLADGTLITGKFSTFSGANVPVRGNLTPEQTQELSSHVVCGRRREEGPKDVDDESIYPNQRGFRSLSGNIRKPVTLLNSGGASRLVTLGGDWHDSLQECQALCRYPANSAFFGNVYLGLRLVCR